MTLPPNGRALLHRMPTAAKVFIVAGPVVMIAVFLGARLWNSGAFSAPEAKTIPDPCHVLDGQAQQIIGAPSVTGAPDTSDLGEKLTRKCTWKADPSAGSLKVEISLHHRSQGHSGIDSARTEVDADVLAERAFPDPTIVTPVADLGDEARQLVGHFNDAPAGLVKTTVIARQANVVVQAQSTGHPDPTPDRLKQLVAMAMAGIKTG